MLEGSIVVQTQRAGITPGMVLIAMAFGAIAAIPVMIFEGAGGIGIGVIVAGSQDLAMAVVIVVIAPLVEEVMKPLGIYLLRMDLRPILTLREWAILGFLAGLAFSLLEDALYIFVYAGPAYGAEGMLATAVFRLHIPVHMVGTTMVGFGVGMWCQSKRIKPFLLTLAFAIAIHAFWNFMMITVG